MWITDGAIAHLRDVAEWPDLGERYEVRRRLGRGGMAVVYAAYDHVIEREVAVKVLDHVPAVADTAGLLSEARILGRLEHPGIVPIHDAGVLDDGRVFYVMKLVRGEPLDRAVATRTLNERLDLFLRICEAVSFAHAEGVVHRDLKPQNIMIGAFGEVLVMDWGVAGVTRPGQRPPNDDLARVVVGTPGYMAPEQQDGRTSTDHRADVYSLGVILASLIAIEAPRSLTAVAERARADDPLARYASVQDLARDVMRFRDGESVLAYREPLLERVARVYRRYELPILLVLVYVIIRVVLLTWRGV